MTFCVATLISLNLYGELISSRLVGTWSNKKRGDFFTIMVSFRTDGKGMYATYGAAPLKWEARETNIIVRIAGEPNNKELIFNFGASTDTMQAIWFDGKTQIFNRVSTEEPIDLITTRRDARIKQWDESRRRFNVVTNAANSLEDLPICLDNFMDSSYFVANATVAQNHTNVIITMQRAESNTAINITCMYAGDGYIEPFSTMDMWADSPPTNEWPQNILIPDDAISHLGAWLSVRNMKAETKFYIYSDDWGLIRYERITSVLIRSMDMTVIETVSYLLQNVFPNVMPPYTIVVSRAKRMSEQSGAGYPPQGVGSPDP